ncbi:hypothetical protein CKW46_12815 [Mycobacterium liflandii]|uniref:Uncharacterized protein n=1 Tax=Mycobacterium ulcerans str. Harvey TaxID=1299332 RepID=A0ABP3AE02_MYCUL|nr:hypothetical protein I551_5365 [Mycobacterium ulcerans str. Harvey]ULL10337.1 hypothetical protein CKW46_12815 [Mycobacterium liflandii]GAQ33357.1 hypothetical protein MPS_1615 [Mycobacterium pseudoshottsii JCM 15466]
MVASPGHRAAHFAADRSAATPAGRSARQQRAHPITAIHKIDRGAGYADPTCPNSRASTQRN